MEYYIMMEYQSAWEKNKDVEQGFSRFSSKTKKIVLISFVIMIISSIFTFIFMISVPKSIWATVSSIIFLTSILIMALAGNADMKNNLSKYSKSYQKKIDILDNILKQEFDNKVEEKIEKLIEMYKKEIDIFRESEQKRTRIITLIASALTGVLTVSFTNVDVIGIDFASWLNIAVILLLIAVWISAMIYSFNYVDSDRSKYEMMVKDLENLKFLKY